MSIKAAELQMQIIELEKRLIMADEAHQIAKGVLSRFEGSCGTPLWERLRNEVDSTLTHWRVLKAVWHRLQADLLEQQTKDGE